MAHQAVLGNLPHVGGTSAEDMYEVRENGHFISHHPYRHHETVVRIPARMAKALKEALDVAELEQLR